MGFLHLKVAGCFYQWGPLQSYWDDPLPTTTYVDKVWLICCYLTKKLIIFEQYGSQFSLAFGA
jgi:hypothetical protein